MNHRIFERMLRSRGHPPRARSLECRSYSLSKCVSAPVGADDTGFVLLLLRRSLVLLCSALAAAAAGGLCARVCVCVWHMALDSSLFQLFLSFSLSLPHGRHAHSARVVFYEGGRWRLSVPFVLRLGVSCAGACVHACARACVIMRHDLSRCLHIVNGCVCRERCVCAGRTHTSCVHMCA